MAFCRSRRTGNCSDYSQNRLLQEKAPEISPGAFLFLDRRPYAAAGWGCSHQYPRLRCGSGEANLFGVCMRLPGRDGTENSRALNGVVWPWRSSKAGYTVPGVPGGEARSVSLIGGPDFDCVSVRVWPCPILIGKRRPGRRSSAPPPC